MTRKSLHLKRFAAISLVIVMCLSALAVLAPSASAAGEGTTYTWTAASDGHYGHWTNPTGERHDELITRILADGTQRHFDIGDLSQDGKPSDYPNIKSKYDSMGVPYHIAIGNHDSAAAVKATFGMASGYYTIIDEDYAWIVLQADVMYGEIWNDQLAYLEAQLKLLEDKLVFVVAHVPQKKVQPGVAVSDVDCVQFIRIVEEHASHIGAVVFGHIHTPTVVEENGVHYVNTGTFGSDDANTLDVYGYMLFSLSSNGGEHTISVSYRDVSTGDAVPGLSATWTIATQPPGERPTYVWDGEGATELASEAANWYQDIGGVIVNDVLPTDNSHVRFDATSTKDCIWDLDAADCMPYSITIATGYSGTVTQGDVDIGIGDGLFIQQDGVFVANDAQQIICAGDVFSTGGDFRSNLANLIMSGDGATINLGDWRNVLRKLTVTGDILLIEGRARELVNTGTISIADTERANFEVVINSKYTPVSYYVVNQGTIDGPGRLVMKNRDNVWGLLEVMAYDVDPTIEIGTASHVRLCITIDATGSRTFFLATPIDCQLLMIDSANISAGTTYTATLDLDAQTITADTLIIGELGAMLGGEGVIHTAVWDSSAGSWTPEDSTVVLSDRGTVKLAPGQSFNRLEISSGNGRTASWTMTATGAQAPIVTGLKSGSYLWYLDGEEQGVIEAGEDGTIALSYESTGLHTLEVKPAYMATAINSIYQVAGIIMVLTVLGGLITMVGRIKF